MKKTERLITLDAFRGITVSLMIMVNQEAFRSTILVFEISSKILPI